MKTTRQKALPFKKSTYLFTIVGGAVLLNPAFAADQKDANDSLEEIVVTGIKASLKASMETKRDAVGVVDAINAEDIGKFPDTNLSEALQRVTGVSIDRRNGEGATVTARGFGAQYNLVTLNGRHIPGADAFGGGDAVTGGTGSGSRSFNFANLAAESISAVEVYKTGRADVQPGGMGATINIRTARPFDNAGLVLNVGAKAQHDTSRNLEGKNITPELSGIFSYTNDSKTWGVGLSASYSERDSGTVESTVNDWHIGDWTAANFGNAVPLAQDKQLSINGVAQTAVITNAPKQRYGIPNDIRYAFSDTKRERLNSQAVLQFAPIESLVLTADYTFARNDIAQDRGEQTTWLQRNGFTKIVFDTNETVATPVLLEEMTGANKDFGYEQQRRVQQNTLDAIGFNANWKVTDSFTLALDYSDAKAKSSPNDPITGGGETLFSLAGKIPSTGNCATASCTNFWKTTMSFNNGLPISVRTLYPTDVDALANTNGNSDYMFTRDTLGSQVLRVNSQAQKSVLKEMRLDGTWDLADAGRFQFGVETGAMEMTQQNSGGYMPLGDWGVGDVGTTAFPATKGLVTQLQPINVGGLFHGYATAGIPTSAYTGNADALGLWGVNTYGNWNEDTAPDGLLRFNPGYNTYNIIREETKSAYVQYAWKHDFGGMTMDVSGGVRYEKTDVTSRSQLLVPTNLLWQDDNDFQVERASTQTLFAKKADYHNVLPNIDFDIGFTKSLKGRLSVSKSMARADYGSLTAAQTVNGANGSTLNGAQATGTSNNPGLLPLESTNIDLSVEWYFSDTGYLSAGFFTKKVKNFIGNSTIKENLFGIKDQTGGADAQAALAFLKANGYNTDDSHLFTATAMLRNSGATGGLAAYNGTEAQHIAIATAYDLRPIASDDATPYIFAVSQPVNNKDAKIHGFEFGGQTFFGDSGFGILANYTIVKGDVKFDDNGDPNVNQFALPGLSDSANVSLMFEKYGWNARLAWNWRDTFLQSTNQGGDRNPVYVQAHKQYDLSVGYDFNKHISASFEGINLTGEDVRWFGRSKKQLWRLEDDAPRYAVGVRYKF